MEPPCSLVIVAGLLTIGCSLTGGQTGEGEPSPASCSEATPVLLGAEEQSPLGFSANDILAFTLRSHDLAAAWPANGDEADGAEPNAATASLTIERRGDAVRFVDSTLDGRSDPDCRSRLEFDVKVTVTLKNDVGTWSFSVDDVVAASNRHLARTNAEFSAADLAGMSQVGGAADERMTRTRLDATFSEFGSSGTLTAILERETASADAPSRNDDAGGPTGNPQATVERHMTLARFPLENPCGRWDEPRGFLEYVDRHPVPNDVLPFDVPISEQLASVDQPLTWLDGESTELSLSVSPRQDTACIWEGCVAPCNDSLEPDEVRATNRTYLSSPMSLSVGTADARWIGNFQGLGLTLLDPAGNAMSGSFSHVSEVRSNDASSALTGLSAVTPTTTEDLKFEVEISRSHDEPAPRGEVRLYTPRTMAPEDCSGDDPCPGAPNGVGDMVERGVW